MNSRLRREIADQAAQFTGVRHAVAIDADNYVAGSQADSRGRRTRKHLADDAALCRAGMERRRKILGQVLRYDAKLSALDFSVRDQFGKNLLRAAEGIAKPRPTLPLDEPMIALFTPTMRPSRSNNGPPELHGLMAASVWMYPS